VNKSNVPNVEVIDLDSIDVTNLNRQFLFRQKDVGSSKAVVAAKFINDRCPWMKVKAHHGKIQDKDSSFYSSFQCIIIQAFSTEERRVWRKPNVLHTRTRSQRCLNKFGDQLDYSGGERTEGRHIL
jgi:hypothetical protein